MKKTIFLISLFVPVVSFSKPIINDKMKQGKINVVEGNHGDVYVHLPKGVISSYSYKKGTLFITDYSKALNNIIKKTALLDEYYAHHVPIIFVKFNKDIDTKESVSFLLGTMKRTFLDKKSPLYNKPIDIITYGPSSGRIASEIYCDQKKYGYNIRGLFLVYPDPLKKYQYKSCEGNPIGTIHVFTDDKTRLDGINYLNYGLGCAGISTTNPIIDSDSTDKSQANLTKFLCQTGDFELYELKNTLPSWPGVGRPQYTGAKSLTDYNNDINISGLIIDSLFGD